MRDTPAAGSGFAALIGYRLAAWRDGYAEVALTIGPQHLNRTGLPHGGLLTTLIDAACGYAGVYSPTGAARGALTLSLATQFIGQARAGATLTATGRVTGGGRQIFFATAEVRDDAGRLIARGDGTFRYRGGEAKPGAV